MSAHGRVSPLSAGLRGRCPECGEGELYESYLKIAPRCESCDADLSKADSGDGPAVFVMFAVGFIVVPLALVFELAVHPPIWLHLLIWLPAVIVLSLMLLPPFKGVLVALQFHHNAEEARLEEDEPPRGG